MEIGETAALDRIVMMGARERDDSLFAGVGIDDKALKTGRDHFVVLGEKKNSRHPTGAGVCDAVEICWNFERHRAGKKPEVPPAELPENDLPQRHRIVQD